MPPPPGKPLRNIRIDDDLWDGIAKVLPPGVDRSEAVRAYLRWVLRRRDGYLLERLSRAEIDARLTAEPEAPTDPPTS